MSKSSPAWQFFDALQIEADPRSIDKSLARDEALDVVFHEILTEPPPDKEMVLKRFHSLCRNRLFKHRHRRALDERRFRATHRRGGTHFGSVVLTRPARSVLDQIAYSQLVTLIRAVLAKEEVSLLLEIIEGHSYADMARDRNLTVSSLKSKACRIRKKVRRSRISAILRSGLRG